MVLGTSGDMLGQTQTCKDRHGQLKVSSSRIDENCTLLQPCTPKVHRSRMDQEGLDFSLCAAPLAQVRALDFILTRTEVQGVPEQVQVEQQTCLVDVWSWDGEGETGVKTTIGR